MDIYVKPVFESSQTTVVYFSSSESAVVQGVIGGIIGGITGGIVGGIVADSFPGPAIPG